MDGVLDGGAKAVSAIASILELEDEENATEEDILELLKPIADPAGLFYMYSLPSSLLRRSQ
jgi:F420-non-reducing hydrogenase small subunit